MTPSWTSKVQRNRACGPTTEEAGKGWGKEKRRGKRWAIGAPPVLSFSPSSSCCVTSGFYEALQSDVQDSIVLLLYGYAGSFLGNTVFEKGPLVDLVVCRVSSCSDAINASEPRAFVSLVRGHCGTARIGVCFLVKEK